MGINEKMTAIADAIRDKTGSAEPLTLDAMATDIPKVFDAGKKTQLTEFWEQFQSEQMANGSQEYKQAFYAKRFSDATYDPSLPIVASGIYQGFMNSRLTNTKVPIIANCNMSGCFRWCNYLVTIVELNVGESTSYGEAFYHCDVLENIVMTGIITTSVSFSHSSKLSKDSILGKVATDEQIAAKTNLVTLDGVSYFGGIFGALATPEDNISGQTLTLSKTAVNKAFATTDGGTDGSTSQEWQLLIAPFTNWTITLS